MWDDYIQGWLWMKERIDIIRMAKSQKKSNKVLKAITF